MSTVIGRLIKRIRAIFYPVFDLDPVRTILWLIKKKKFLKAAPEFPRAKVVNKYISEDRTTYIIKCRTTFMYAPESLTDKFGEVKTITVRASIKQYYELKIGTHIWLQQKKVYQSSFDERRLTAYRITSKKQKRQR